MDLRPLRYFVEVVRQGSFTRAAELLHISQPSISKMIKHLEDEVGAVLLDRTARSVVLTDAGQVVYNRAQQVISGLDDLSHELSDLAGLARGTVKVGMPPMVGVTFFPEVIAAFHAQYPKVQLRLYEDGAKKVEQLVADGVLDLGIALLPVDEDLFDFFPFVREQLMLVVHPAHPLAGRRDVALRELHRQDLILFREDFTLHDRILKALQVAGAEPEVVAESSQWDFIGEMVAANLGVALLPEPICRRLDARRVAFAHLAEQRIPWHLAVIWRKERYLSFAARGWIDFARARLERGLFQPQITQTRDDNTDP